MQQLPARHPYLELTDLEGEMLVYNPVTNQAFTLDSLSARVLQSCDGQTERAAMLASLGESIPEGTEEVLQHTLEQLAQNGMLPAPPSPQGLTRRELIQRWGLAAAALPLIASVNLPKPAAAASGGGSCACSSCSCGSCSSCSSSCGSCTSCGSCGACV